ncbi:probable N-acetyltransferase HLS1 [Typha angustifolia]|uniref:probable N-acetyltransferase HLS1 n=1 Tax=Typha angustifolia TaxID=59011 RepID=UPI003C2ABB5C
MEEEEEEGIVVREYHPEKDRAGADSVDRVCEVGTSGKVTLYTDLLGDPIARIRHSPAYLMLVAETSGPAREIVGLIRGCVKTVTCGKKTHRSTNTISPVYTKVGYILGLRVSPSHRRKGIGLRLVRKMEEWFRDKGAEYAYMATDKDNEASLRLFTGRCGYSKFRSPSILVHPVFAHRLRISRHVSIVVLPTSDAELLYRRRFSTVEFFPRDIDAVLSNPFSLFTILAVTGTDGEPYRWPGVDAFLASPPGSWAVASVWDTGAVFQLELRGVSRIRRAIAAASRAVDRSAPWLRIPAFPDLFRPFSAWFLYGVGGEGPDAAEAASAICRHVHNLARGRAAAVATEVAEYEPLRKGIPHWRKLSCDDDLWCAKRLAEEYSDGEVGDWTKSVPGKSIFVDPREV